MKVGPQIPVSQLPWMIMDLELAGQKGLLLNRVRAFGAQGLCSLETAEKEQPWSLHGQLMAPSKHFPWPETGTPLGSSLSKACTKAGLPLVSAAFYLRFGDFFYVGASYCDPYADCFKVC